MSQTKELQMIYRPIEELEPSPRNPRTHSKKQVTQIERSIREFGFVNPVLVDRNDRIVAGHGRVMAAKNLGMKEVPVVCVSHLTPAQVKAYLIADNKIAGNAGWDHELLAAELKELSLNMGFDITVTGVEMAELDQLLLDSAVEVKEDKVSGQDRSQPAVSRAGDLWRIGDHMVLCGDSTDRAAYVRLMGNETAGLVFTDPPYNVPVVGHVSGKGKIVHEEFAMASGEMSEAQFTDFLKTVFRNLAEFSGDGSLHYICMDWRHMMEVLTAGKATYTELKNLCVWTKTNGGMGNLYRSQHELVFVYKYGTGAHINNVELGKHGRNRTNVWPYAGAKLLEPLSRTPGTRRRMTRRRLGIRKLISDARQGDIDALKNLIRIREDAGPRKLTEWKKVSFAEGLRMNKDRWDKFTDEFFAEQDRKKAEARKAARSDDIPMADLIDQELGRIIKQDTADGKRRRFSMLQLIATQFANQHGLGNCEVIKLLQKMLPEKHVGRASVLYEIERPEGEWADWLAKRRCIPARLTCMESAR